MCLTLYNIPIQEYSVQLTFRQDWLDPRLAYPNTDGMIYWTYSSRLDILFSRQTEVPHNDRPRQSVDAGYLLPEWKDRALPQHHRTQRVHPDIPQWEGVVQHQVGGVRNWKESLPFYLINVSLSWKAENYITYIKKWQLIFLSHKPSKITMVLLTLIKYIY